MLLIIIVCVLGIHLKVWLIILYVRIKRHFLFSVELFKRNVSVRSVVDIIIIMKFLAYCLYY